MKTTTKTTIIIIGSIVLISGAVYFIVSASKNRGKSGKSGKLGKWGKFWEKMIFGVISVEYGFNTPCDNIYSKGCRGKRYTDVLKLDSGTVGIAHWASGGLCRLYESMDTQKYFNRSQKTTLAELQNLTITTDSSIKSNIKSQAKQIALKTFLYACREHNKNLRKLIEDAQTVIKHDVR